MARAITAEFVLEEVEHIDARAGSSQMRFASNRTFM
jgi:hypothetical protein